MLIPPATSFESVWVGRPSALFFVTGVALSSTPTTNDGQRLTVGLVPQAIDEGLEIRDEYAARAPNRDRAQLPRVEERLNRSLTQAEAPGSLLHVNEKRVAVTAVCGHL